MYVQSKIHVLHTHTRTDTRVVTAPPRVTQYNEIRMLQQKENQ